VKVLGSFPKISGLGKASHGLSSDFRDSVSDFTEGWELEIRDGVSEISGMSISERK
jgi:hypothetical protein